MKLLCLISNRLALSSSQLTTLKYVLGSAVALFCLTNVYRSATNPDFISSHEYLGRSEVKSSRSSSWNASFLRSRRKDSSVDHLERMRIPDPDDFPPYNKSVSGQLITVPLWQRRLAAGYHRNRSSDIDGVTAGEQEEEEEDKEEAHKGVYYYLAALLQVRIYIEDKARWSVNELIQWMHYLFLTGVQHVYLCDHFMYDYERLDGPLARYIRAGLVTYVSWGKVRDPMTAQVKCYQRIISRYRRRHLWQIAIDMDEYPFSPNDTDEDFLLRYLAAVPDHVTEVSMPNYLMLGRGDRSGRLVIERINRMTKDSNALVKPIYRPSRVRANIHHNHLLSGSHVDASPDRLRMLHYWGARSQHWGPDTPRVLAMTVVMNRMRDAWAVRLRHSLLVFDESQAITNDTGP